MKSIYFQILIFVFQQRLVKRALFFYQNYQLIIYLLYNFNLLIIYNKKCL